MPCALRPALTLSYSGSSPGGAESGDIAGAEAADGVGVKRRFAGGQQRDALPRWRPTIASRRRICGWRPASRRKNPAAAVLRFRAATDRRCRRARRNRRDRAPCRRGHSHWPARNATSASRSTSSPTRGWKLALGDRGARRHTLQHGVDGGDDDRRRLAPLASAASVASLCAFDIGLGRNPVIGQTVPGRKGQHRKSGAKKPMACAAASACIVIATNRTGAPRRRAASPAR